MSTASGITSKAEAPDLDWSQVSETVRMLNLAVAQISMAMHEGEDSLGTLTASFSGMVSSVDEIARIVNRELSDADAAVDIFGECSRVHDGVQQSIMAFQFYDRLSQRLDHVKEALEQLGKLVADPGRLYSPQEWTRLQQRIRSRYTMREEQEMFDALLRGESVEQALEAVKARLEAGDIDDIELF